MPMRGELSVPAVRAGGTVGGLSGWDRIVVAVTHPDCLKVAGICVLGLTITLMLISLSPDAGEIIQSSNLYP